MVLDHYERKLMILLVKLNVTHLNREFGLTSMEFIWAMVLMGKEENLDLELEL